jgi:nitrogen fixation protein NifB
MMKAQRQTDHPCFGGDHKKAARVHLPVAPGCNIKCGFCDRKFDCVNESRPGITSKVLTPEQALKRVALVDRHMKTQDGPSLKVVGIAGPGDPLANPKTFETFELVREAYPDITLCMSTNGLRLPENMQKIVKLGLHSLTVTINALTPETGAKIYEWVRYDGKKLEGVEGAKLLLEKQLEGVRLAALAGLMVKVNHVYIPGVNDHETLDLAIKVRELGADIMNIMPIIPVGKFEGVEKPSELTMDMIRNQAELILSQARHCKQCRADAAGIIGQDIDLETLENKQQIIG